jgi:hypothetical protein
MAASKNFILQDSCLDSGRKWSTNQNGCILKTCTQTNNCLPSYKNNAICKSLQTGITSEELFFHLGMPESSNGSLYIFAGAALEPKIIATIKSGKVEGLQCGT